MQTNIFKPTIKIENIKEILKNPVEGDEEFVNSDVHSKLRPLFIRSELLFKIVQEDLQPRSNWPRKLSFFPFNLPSVKNFALRIYNSLFKDQRRANYRLVEISEIMQSIVNELSIIVSQISKDQHSLNEQLSQKTDLSGSVTSAQNKLKKSELDNFFIALTDKFRGSCDHIKNHLTVYLPYVKAVEVIQDGSPILDIACGRGEWLDLLRENGIKAQGVDLNRELIKQCKRKDLDVKEEDMFQYLKSIPTESLGGVTGFHIIEHISFDQLIILFKEVKRVLKKGGFVIFETPNSQNTTVGTSNFYLDPTHRNPLPHLLMQFCLEHVGFSNVQVLFLSPCSEEVKVKDDSDLANRFNMLFYGPQDYGLIAYKQN